MIFERVRRCRFCRREMKCSAAAYAENPFCTACYDERVKGVSPSPPTAWRTDGDYLIATGPRTPSSSGSSRPRR